MQAATAKAGYLRMGNLVVPGFYCSLMAVDVGKFLRLQGAIDAAVASVPADHAATAAGALVSSYVTLRQEVRLVIDESVHDEFDRLFPMMEAPASPNVRRGFDPIASADQANQARTRLKMMGGWLGGFLRVTTPD
jgi:hypothetical protein